MTPVDLGRWLAETSLRPGRDTFQKLRTRGLDVSEFVLDNGRVLSAHDLTAQGWSDLIERGTVEEFPASEWADAEDPDKQKRLVQLLNHCLNARARQVGVGRRKDDDSLYFLPSEDLSPREVPFRSVKETATRTVFKAYMYSKGDRTGDVAYYRHAACHPQFRRYDGQWFLEILPTYHFTSDGRRPHPLRDRHLSGMKKQEKQGAVLYQVVMWASILRGAEEVDAEYFSTNAYPFLRFGPLQTLELNVGIDDKAWLPNEDKETEKVGEETMEELPLFEVVDPYAPTPSATEGLA